MDVAISCQPYILEYSSRGMDFYTLADFYVKGYQVVRANENIIDGANEIMVVIHDAFQPLLNWRYFWGEESLGLNWTNYALDTREYWDYAVVEDPSDGPQIFMMLLVAPIKSHIKSTWTQYVPYPPLSLKRSSISQSLLENLPCE